MRCDNPVQTLADALGASLHRDFSDIDYEDRDWVEYKKGNDVRVKKTRRPTNYDVEVVMFPQTWGSTALGYGGIGGAAITSAYTVVVNDYRTYCVYFGCDRLAYKIDVRAISPEGRENFLKDLMGHTMAGCKEAAKRYK